MKLSNGALVAVVDGEKLVLFKNTNAQEIRLSPLEIPAMEDRGVRLVWPPFQRGQPGQ